MNAILQVGIIIPTFNRANLIARAIGSVIAQTYENWRLYIIDDHSEDDTRSVVDRYIDQDSRIKYFVNSRSKGVSGARNTGILMSQEEFVAFLDSDDEWTDNHLEESVCYLISQPDSDAVAAGVIRKHQSTTEVYSTDIIDLETISSLRVPDAKKRQVLLFDYIFRHNPFSIQTLVVRRRALSHILFQEDFRVAEDWFFQLELAYNGSFIGYIARPHVIYWAHDANTTVAGGAKNALQRIALYPQYFTVYNYVRRKFPLSRSQGAFMNKMQAEIACWNVGYSGYSSLGRHLEASYWYWTAIKLCPWHPPYWKMFLSSILKSCHKLCCFSIGSRS